MRPNDGWSWAWTRVCAGGDVGWSIPYGLRDAVNNVGFLKLLWYCFTDKGCRGYVVACCEVLGYQEP